MRKEVTTNEKLLKAANTTNITRSRHYGTLELCYYLTHLSPGTGYTLQSCLHRTRKDNSGFPLAQLIIMCLLAIVYKSFFQLHKISINNG